jgi:hypothetical protein
LSDDYEGQETKHNKRGNEVMNGTPKNEQETNETDRENRLFAVGCARLVQHLMIDKRSLDALSVAERFANGSASKEELGVARDAARRAAWDAIRDSTRAEAWAENRVAVRDAAGVVGLFAALDVARDSSHASVLVAKRAAACTAAFNTTRDSSMTAANDSACSVKKINLLEQTEAYILRPMGP